MPEWLRRAVTFVLVVVGWVLFRSTSFVMAVGWLKKMFVWERATNVTGAGILVLLILIAGGLAHFCPNSFELSHRWGWASAFALAALFAACISMMYGSKPTPFLYFQF
jgi:alginate O-acetyltransferase complex protein AlgI